MCSAPVVVRAKETHGRELLLDANGEQVLFQGSKSTKTTSKLSEMTEKVTRRVWSC